MCWRPSSTLLSANPTWFPPHILADPMTATGSSHANLSLAVLCAAGGAVGYVKAKSLPSAIAGLSFGAAYGAGAYMINGGDPAMGHAVGLVTSVLLSGVMGARFARSGKFMPAGLMAAAGALGAWYNLQKYQEWTAA